MKLHYNNFKRWSFTMVGLTLSFLPLLYKGKDDLPDDLPSKGGFSYYFYNSVSTPQSSMISATTINY